ncbi:endonuclease/exonuclease/phosphatase family protein [Pyxidicoccus sp. MSG2]|uniref:endonuclease/exonuclease/phosphatase family protein n=1 Tax=Pyxidicoccus sp. MSG2 TaxID=2996790 RepID=UPI0022717BC4|nr:endonuclease/exonuclease/phosphatase family protein [Pyxidicoccus sp. MSG2]MCY1021145.1 endonuclease/exonuclease/phosphatase family protein [Pyxidicoccus sp. MSG2]
MRLQRLAVLLLLAACGSHTPASPPPLKAMAYNVLYSSSEEDVRKSLDVIAKEQPDILCLRELTPRFARAFQQRLGKEYPHSQLLPRKGTWGVGIASRHRLLRTEQFSQRPHRMPALEADVRVGKQKLKVVCVHLMAPGSTHRKGDGLLESIPKNAVLREKQGRALVKRYAREQGPLLLLGDMNEDRSGAAMQALAAADFAHACDGPGASCGATWPGATSVLPSIVEIDHILGRRLTLAGAKVLREGGSDHYPVRASFGFAP